jgi:hypothetical protein
MEQWRQLNPSVFGIHLHFGVSLNIPYGSQISMEHFMGIQLPKISEMFLEPPTSRFIV